MTLTGADVAGPATAPRPDDAYGGGCRIWVLPRSLNGTRFISTMIWIIEPTAPSPLREQIADCVRRAITRRELRVGDQLPPAAELADALSVDRNTVLAAYRQLRDIGVLEFRRGRGVRVATATQRPPAVMHAAAALIDAGRSNGLDREDLIQLIRELA